MQIKRKLKVLSEIGLSFCSYLLYYLFKILPYKLSLLFADFIGKYILSNIIPSRKKIGITNINLCFPDFSLKKSKQIYKQSCGLAVRNFAEKINIETIIKKQYYTINDPYKMIKYMENHKALMFSAHLGNWELLTLPFITNSNKNLKNDILVAYKTPQNKFVIKLLDKVRSYLPCHHLDLTLPNLLKITKSILNDNKKFLMLADQRVNNGLVVNLLNRPAATSSVIPTLSIKYNIPIIPIRVVRKGTCNFHIIIDNLIYPQITDNKNKDILNITTMMNDIISSWIREKPEQWYWLHNRWQIK